MVGVASFDGEHGSGPARVNVRGLNRALRQLATAGVEAQDQRELMHRLGNIVVNRGRQLVNSKTGTLAAAIRAGRGKTKAVVRAGGARARYAGVNHYGNPYTGSASNAFLVNALRDRRAEVMREFEHGLDALLKKHNLT